MHSISELIAYSYNNVAKDSCSAVCCALYPYNILVLDAELLSCLRDHVDVTLCNDNALLDLNLACGASQDAAGSTCNIAALLDSDTETDGASVCSGKLNLICRTYRAEDGYVCKLLLGAYNCDTLLTSLLTGLGKILLLCELVALAEQDFKCLLCNVSVTCGCFDKNFCHFYVPPMMFFAAPITFGAHYT